MPELSLHLWIIIQSVVWGLAGASLGWVLLDWLGGGRASWESKGRFEIARRERLREANQLFKAFEPGIARLAAWNERRNPVLMTKMNHNLVVSAEKLPWKASEYLAYRQVESVFAGIVIGVIGYLVFEDPWVGVGCGVAGLFLYVNMAVKSLEKAANKRLLHFKRRLPFAIDLMALMMEAGASFQDAMGTVVKESQGHPIADEFGQIIRDISLGRTRQESLISMQHRLNDDDVTEIVFAVNKGEELGTPLGQILRNQAEQMRLKRSQWAEKASSEAQVNIVFPGMIIMIACLLIIVAPFIINTIVAEAGQ